MDSSKSLKSIPVPEFANFALEQFSGNFDHVITYLETVVMCIQDLKSSQGSISGLIHPLESSFQPSIPGAVVELNDKFLSDNANFELKYGKKTDFMAGLEAYIGRPKNPEILREMELEHNNERISGIEFSPSNNKALVTTSAEEWLFVRDPRAYTQVANAKSRLILPRTQTSIEELMSHELRFRAELTEAEVVAARLYSGPMFKLYNDVLRNPPGRGQSSFIYTIHAFASCIVKLARVHRITTLYRGIKGGALPQTFLTPDEYGCCGGVEYGFMSTTTVKEVAQEYALGKGAASSASVIYEIDEGSIDRGADISWLSQFPQENEVVFPPLTNLEVVGKAKVVDGAIVAKLRVNINLRTLTVDEVIAKSRKQFMDMMEWYFDEVKTADFGFDPTVIFPGWLEDFFNFRDVIAKIDDPSVFNKHSFYRKLVDDALDLKEGTIQKVCTLRLLKALLPEMAVVSDETALLPPRSGHTTTVHNLASFKSLIIRLEGTHASRFADPKFLMRYVDVKSGCVGKDGQAALANYEQLWKLPLHKRSWAQLVREKSSVPPVRVALRHSCAQRIRDFFYQFEFIKGTMQQAFGFQAIDALLGVEGEYYCIGLENGKPFYQLSRQQSSLSSKYLYFNKSHWYIGSTLGSEVADLRSSTQNDPAPCDVRVWEKTSAPLIMTFIVSSCKYSTEESAESKSLEEGFTVNIDSPLGQTTVLGTNPLLANRHKMVSSANPPHERRISTEAVIAGEKWAFVHRMIEEQDDGPQDITQSELHSIAVFCQQAGCPIPKTVSSCLLRESSAARLVVVLVVAWVIITCYIIFGLGFWIAFMSLGIVDDSFLFTIACITRGMIFEIGLLGFIGLSALAAALNGFSCKSAAAILSAVIVFSGVFTVVWMFIAPSDTYGIRTEMIFIAEGITNLAMATMLFTLLAR